jgi:glycosyltransferase involved in cell wall biosynthesis
VAAERFIGKVALQQRVLAAYRAPLFDRLAEVCDGGLNVCAGLPRKEESIAITDQLKEAKFTPVHNTHFLSGAYYFCFQNGLLRWIKECSPDVLIVEANPRYLSTPAPVKWMKQQKLPVIGWGLGAPNLSGPLSQIRQSRRKSFIQSFDGLITYSQRGADEYAQLGFPSKMIFVAPNAATAAPKKPIPNRPPATFGMTNLLFVGRLQARKRVDLLIRSCAALPLEIQPHLVIVGDGPERENLLDIAKKIYPSTVFAGDRRGIELENYFLEADLFVLPGTGGLAAQEAMSYGLPVIMGQGDGTNDALVHPENGWQVPPDDLGALINTLKNALSNPERLRQMGRESYRIVTEDINLEKMVEVFIKTLNAVNT